MERKEVINRLRVLSDNAPLWDKQVFEMAISSLETDEAYQLEYERTTKNDLGVENDLISSVVEKISEKITETHEEFIFETIRPYCENVVQTKISKRDLEQALLKYYGKNDLAVDCISRQSVIDAITANCIWENEYNLTSSRIKKAVENLPSVTLQEPKTGHWKSTIDGKPICSECGFVSESEDGYFVSHYCPNCGCRMVEPQESEGKE